MSPRCTYCGKPLNPRAEGVFVEQQGWSVNRSEGGSNQLSLRQETGRLACASCIRLKVRGIDPQNQGRLV